VLISAALLGAVFVYVDVGDIAIAVRDGHWGWFAAAAGLMGAAAIPGSLRWQLILRGSEIEITLVRAVKTFAASLVLNNVLPTSVGGDAARAWSVGKESGRLLRAALATVVDRATAVACLFVVAWLAVSVDAGTVPSVLIGVLLWITVGLALATLVAALIAAGIRPVVRRIPQRLATMIREAWATVRAWAQSANLVGWVLALGVLYQVLAVIALILVGRAVGVDLSFALAAATAAIVVVAMLVPISIGGLGVREGGFVLLLGEAGVGGADATLVSLLSVVAIVLANVAVVLLAGLYEVIVASARARSLPREPSG
jgi:uncharacterized protein (TIRG00374 family)